MLSATAQDPLVSCLDAARHFFLSRASSGLSVTSLNLWTGTRGRSHPGSYRRPVFIMKLSLLLVMWQYRLRRDFRVLLKIGTGGLGYGDIGMSTSLHDHSRSDRPLYP